MIFVTFFIRMLLCLQKIVKHTNQLLKTHKQKTYIKYIYSMVNKGINSSNNQCRTTLAGSSFFFKASLSFTSSTYMRLQKMKLFILAQYFTVTMVLTITIGLFALKPVVNHGLVTTAQVATATTNKQEMFVNEKFK
ncbi:hypothetical protein CXF74_10620 [Psychromonas sp. Urea-02u-13]|nr:hypothetical protein CXF74_10620 [Psychromonas sp. Urea-02u-13]